MFASKASIIDSGATVYVYIEIENNTEKGIHRVIYIAKETLLNIPQNGIFKVNICNQIP